MQRHLPKADKGFHLRGPVHLAQPSRSFSIPCSRIQLADYLNCDRSALSRELSQMQRDGLLDTYKSSFKLLEPAVLKQMVQ